MDNSNVLNQVNITIVPETRNYWFVRTLGGRLFHPFYDNGFIATLWNEITIDDLKGMEHNQAAIKNRLIELGRKEDELEPDTEDYSPKKSKKEQTASSKEFNMLRKFRDMRKGDVVVIPSANSDMMAFGVIEDDYMYSDVEEQSGCPYHKRRRVKWLEMEATYRLDSVFSKMSHRHQGISDINEYKIQIESVIDSLYQVEDYTYFVIDVTTEEKINLLTLKSLFQAIDFIAENISETLKGSREEDEISVQIRLNSPGKILLMAKSAALMSSIAIIFAQCADTANEPTTTKTIEQTADSILTLQNVSNNSRNDTLRQIQGSIIDLGIPKKKMDKIRK